MISSPGKMMIAVHIEPNAASASWVGRDGELRRARVLLCEADWSEAWNSGLHQYDDAFSVLMKRLGVPRGTSVVVAFESPTCVSEAQSMPEGDIQNALSSLRLAMCERLSLSRRSESVCTKRVFSASRGKNKRSGVAIVAASSEKDVDSIRAWVERAGFRCLGVVPSGALLLNEAARVSKANPGSGLQVNLHVDNYRCSLCVTMDGHAELLRTFEIGLNNLGEAVIRAAEGSGEQYHSSYTLTNALESLHSHGIPQRGTTFDQELGLSANSVLPLLQPVLQRLCVEIKQSLRMVLRRAGSSMVHLQLRGPGASVPRLHESIAQSIDAELATDEHMSEDMSVEDCLRRGGWRDLALSSAKIQAIAGSLRFRRAIACGALLGIVALGVESVHYLGDSAELTAQTLALDEQVRQVREFRAMSEAAVEMDDRLGQGHDLLGEFLGDQPYWNAVITGVTKSAHTRVELTEIRGIAERDGASVLIYGIADATSDSTVLNEFIEKLETCYLGDSVEVESRLLIEMEKNPVYQFRLRMSLIEFRPELMTMGYTP